MEIHNIPGTEERVKNKRAKRRRRRLNANNVDGAEGNSRPAEKNSEAPTRKRKRKSGSKNCLPSQPNCSIQTPKPSDNQSQKGTKAEPTKLSTSKSSSLLDKMRARLSGGHFRMLNEKLYTCRGSEALELFKNDPSLFNVYHAGYQEQMSHWPQQPVDVIVKWLKERSNSLVVADFGCGDARLSKSVKNKVFSIDLVSSDPSVIACDMACTSLAESSVDVAVFCLSLMGTNFPDYLREAYRVLKLRGWLLVAEVKSRFDPGNGGADPNKFVKALNSLGFNIISKDCSNKMFILFCFRKEKGSAIEEKQIEWPKLKPCMYKRR